MKKFDFSGWATKNNIPCSDGRTIIKDAFKHNAGQTVPLVWNHQHSGVENILGHAILENREEGVYAYCTFNDSENGQTAKVLVKHGDISHLSIYANGLKQQGANVLHGAIREVSLVLAGANPGALIDAVMAHSNSSDEEAIIYTDETLSIKHGEIDEESLVDEEELDENLEEVEEETVVEGIQEEVAHAATADDETIAEVFDTLTDKQKDVVYAMIGLALETEAENNVEHSEGGEQMKKNIFDQEDQIEGTTLTHSDMVAILSDAKRGGSLKDAFIAHGITDVGFLFPEAQTLQTTPEFIKRDTGWVAKFMSGVHRTPFSRIKSVFADITEEDARAKGYLKGALKKDEVFSLLKRSTTPTTIYKKQKMDRDDIIDITDFDVIAWLKMEMRMMLDEEIARAALIGDGRLSSSDDKISELNIRPIWKDEDLYTIKARVVVAATATTDEIAKAFIRASIKNRKNYKGSGNPVLYTTEDMLTDCLLLEDTTGRTIYDSVTKLASVLRVSEIVTVPVMEAVTREDGLKTLTLMGIIVNLDDYNIGADKGGAINMFDDFDIDYNKQKYLIETRCSGALTRPYSAIAVELEVQSAG